MCRYPTRCQKIFIIFSPTNFSNALINLFFRRYLIHQYLVLTQPNTN